MKHFGLESEDVEIADFIILTPQIHIGGALAFSFSVTNKNAQVHPVRLEYAIYFKRQNGLVSKKVFKISERVFRPGEKVQLLRKQSFKIITTRKYYPGKHGLSIIINGAEKGTGSFELNAEPGSLGHNCCCGNNIGSTQKR